VQKNKPAHERQCTGFWPCQKLDLEFAVFWADDQYRMDTTAKVLSSLSSGQRVELLAVDKHCRKGLASGEVGEALFALKSLYLDVRCSCEDQGCTPNTICTYLQEGEARVSLELLPLRIQN